MVPHCGFDLHIRYFYCSHFIDVETEVQSSKVICPNNTDAKCQRWIQTSLVPQHCNATDYLLLKGVCEEKGGITD